MSKKSFILYNDLKETVDLMPDDMAGRLFKMMLDYVNGDPVDTDDIALKVAFKPIQLQIDRDAGKYAVYLQKQRDNGKRGGRPKKANVTQKTQAFSKKPKKADNVNVTVNGNDTKKKGTNVPKEKAAPSSLDVEFESFWEGCQKKVAKPAAKKAWMKMRKENRTDLSADKLLAKYNALVESDMAERGTKEFVPHPSTWINQDRWDDEVIESPKKYPFNQRVVFMAKDEIHPLNQGFFQWFYDRTWYVNDEKKRVYDESGKYRDDLYVDPEGDIQQW